MKPFDWSVDKNEILKIERDVSFEDVVLAVQEGRLLKTVNHPNQEKHPGQKIMIIEIDNYAYVIPYVEDEQKFFLKTIYPSRAATKKYLIKNNEIS
ncbi:toxin [Candidatus Gottesmanbacteria bacterium]|nr:toxin [Candidatus Gottesmanbacteria bacterium]